MFPWCPYETGSPVAVLRHIGKSYLSKIRQTSSLDMYLWMILAVKRSAHCEQSSISSTTASKRSLQNFEALYHRVQTNTSELTETSYWPITENTHFVQLLIAYLNKSAASNSTFICFESSLLFFSTR